MNCPASFKHTFDTEDPPKFKKDTLTTLQLIKSYNPTFVTTFIVSHRQAQYLTGDDLRRYENMITLKRKKEINAKYTGLLKSKVKSECSGTSCKKKSNMRTDSAKPKRASSKMESKKKSDIEMTNLDTSKKDRKKNLNMKEIFKSNVFSFSTTSSFNDLIKSSADHLPSPRDIIKKGGGKIRSFWNIQTSMEGGNSIKKKNKGNEAEVNTHKIDAKNQHLNLESDRKKCLQQDQENGSTVSHVKDTEADLDCSVNDVILQSTARTERRVAKRFIKSINTQTNRVPVLKMTKNLLRRNCFSLLNIYSSNNCKLSYKSCLYCYGTNNSHMTSSKKMRFFIPNPENEKLEFVGERSTAEKQSSSIRFISIQFTNYKMEMAQSEYILEQRFQFDEQNESNIIGMSRTIGHLVNSLVNSTPKKTDTTEVSSENGGNIKLVCDSSLSLNVKYKIVLVTSGVALCFWAIFMSLKFC